MAKTEAEKRLSELTDVGLDDRFHETTQFGTWI
jgi:hypothetical protein